MNVVYKYRAVGSRPRRRAISQIYLLVAFPLLVGCAVIGVDVGRRSLARHAAQATADAAARYAARGMQTSSTPLTTARAHAGAVAAESDVDGSAPTIDSAEVVRGTWDAATRTFTADSTGDAVSVTVRQNLQRAGAAPMFSSIFLGSQNSTVVATAVARSVEVSTEIEPPASGNLWLSGMPDDTLHQNYRADNSTVWDNSGTASTKKQRPLEVSLSALNLKAGDTINLEGISGNASWQNNDTGSINTADGDATKLCANGVYPGTYLPNTSANGMSNVRAPIGAVMAVFIADDRPDSSGAPPNLDFGTANARDYSTISPKLKQVFYVGDGKRANGESQTIVVPDGATRVFLGMMDAWQWNDNVGNFKTKMYVSSTIHLVK
ncbi:MAG: pilus assembly protein TadG-related protein [Phycisphaerae bacterium]